MGTQDIRPLPNTPASGRITQRCNNRFGAVLSSLYNFWSARAAAVTGPQSARRDSYSIILFDDSTVNVRENDFFSSPDQLLHATLHYTAGGNTNFTVAVERAKSVMERHWSTERCVDYTSTVLSDLQRYFQGPCNDILIRRRVPYCRSDYSRFMPFCGSSRVRD